jgi:hypothetical protein
MQEHAHSTSLWIKHARLQQFSASANTCYARKREKPWVSQKEEASSGVAHHRRASTQAVASHVAREGLLRTQISSTAATRHHHSRNSQIQSMVARPPSQPQLARRRGPPSMLQLTSTADEQQRAPWRFTTCLWRSSLASPPLQGRANLHGCRRGHHSLAGIVMTGQEREHRDAGELPQRGFITLPLAPWPSPLPHPLLPPPPEFPRSRNRHAGC